MKLLNAYNSNINNYINTNRCSNKKENTNKDLKSNIINIMNCNICMEKKPNYMYSKNFDDIINGESKIKDDMMIFIFFVRNPFEKILIKAFYNEPISAVLKRYNKIVKDYNPNTTKFLFNGKCLNPQLTVIESGLTEGSTVTII